jgi:glycosyltransferase involved in cell wall biosynthesis
MNLKKLLFKTFPQLKNIGRKIKAKKWEKDSIVYYVGNRKEPLTPNSLKQGTSGSYTALIYLCQEWAKSGRKVTVYAPCGNQAGLYDGVEYVDYYKFNPEDTFDILIIFQHSYLLPLPIKARKVCFEWQDIYGPKLQPREKLERFDLIFAKSQYQRNLMDFIPDEKFVIVTNGINPHIAELSSNKKEPYKLVYASRYYRGLEEMLTYGWPLIKREIPEAELHIYYGFVLREMSKDQQQWRNKMIELMKQPGVIHRGRVSQDQLILDKSFASIHYYAGTYPEIDCISLRESAAVGCVPVTTTCGVFAEKEYAVKVEGEPKTKETQEAVAGKVIELLKNPQELAQISQKFRELAIQETWDQIAPVWLSNFDQ